MSERIVDYSGAAWNNLQVAAKMRRDGYIDKLSPEAQTVLTDLLWEASKQGVRIQDLVRDWFEEFEKSEAQ